MTLAAGDLTTLANAKLWLMQSGPAPTDQLVLQLISRVSGQIRSWLSRPRLLSWNYSKTFDGTGTAKIMLPDWPVTGISLVQIGHDVVKPYPLTPYPNPPIVIEPELGAWGYRFNAWDGGLPGAMATIEVLGGRFHRGHQNILVNYTAGYLISGESQVIPADTPYQVTVEQPQGICCTDGGVVYANGGGVLLAVAANPAQGQYVAPVDAAPGVYTFAAADANAGVLISYSYVPIDLQSACEQAVTQLYQQIAMMYGLGNLGDMRVGDTELKFVPTGTSSSGTMAGQPVLWTPAITAALLPYKTVAPVQRGAAMPTPAAAAAIQVFNLGTALNYSYPVGFVGQTIAVVDNLGLAPANNPVITGPFDTGTTITFTLANQSIVAQWNGAVWVLI